MDPRTDRIIQVAIELAESEGYDAVRLREVASRADVALGTVYRRFSCKEDILAAALEQQVTVLHAAIAGSEIPGETGEERLVWFFEIATRLLAASPKLAAATLRSVASGVPEIAERVTRYQGYMGEIVLGVYRGDFSDVLPSEDEQHLARLLLHVWFGSLVGWTGGLHDVEVVVEQMSTATGLFITALHAKSNEATP